jgi:hypothetical protein
MLVSAQVTVLSVPRHRALEGLMAQVVGSLYGQRPCSAGRPAPNPPPREAPETRFAEDGSAPLVDEPGPSSYIRAPKAQ